MINHLAPDILSDLEPPDVRESNPYSLRNSSDIQTIHARTNLNSFLLATVRDWNNLPLHVQQSDSLETFKKYLNSDLSPSPFFYNAGSRLGQVLHTRLRLECSSLNAHLYSRNLVESPLCACSEIENTTHFIFKCPNYSVVRQTYLTELTQQCTLKDLMFGQDGVRPLINEDIFLCVHEYILHTKRFNA